MSPNPLNDLGSSLGDYLREQRQSARLSLRQLSELAGVSNPYLSQIERGVKKPSAEILQQLAKGLQISSESLYVKAGFLDGRQGLLLAILSAHSTFVKYADLWIRQQPQTPDQAGK